MLYITTRNDTDYFTAHKALTNNIAPDGGGYVPFRFPEYSKQELLTLRDKTFNQIVAEIVNQFYSLHLNDWDLGFNVGRNVLKISQMSHRVAIAELWHSLGGSYKDLEKAVTAKMAAGTKADVSGSKWSKLAVRIATLFGIYGELLKSECLDVDQMFDVSVLNDDLFTLMAAVYSRMMGLPVNTIICTCDSNNSVWDFIHKGTVNPTVHSANLQTGMERLVHGMLGIQEANRFYMSCCENKTYSLDEETLQRFNSGLFCVVAGKSRASQLINSLFRMNSYIADVDVALAYGGMQDYRAKTGAAGLTLLLSDNSPLKCAGEIASATGLDEEKIKSFL